ncbi:pyroglutamyl-peptidase I [Bacillus sp. FJAT-27445]|uniref:pyroglutamyl-peptidase I n=1 Tax=Bacillus sp. FJAT-27445 TaxID=1679166 RepID=UPI0007444F87|nr:pyroglutamyl-peptidase I [Bacillus sp. FJAT-27445]
MKNLLLTGFEPFLSFPINPTAKIVSALDGQEVGGYKITGLLLPVDYNSASERLLKKMRETEPDAIVSLGLAAGRSSITPERIAINCRDGAADNNGVALEDAPIVEGGPDGYLSTLPIRRMVNSLKESGFPAEVSNSAGTYLCNNVMYSAIHELAAANNRIPAGFVHIPASHELAVAGKKTIPSWSDRDLLDAVKVLIEVLE